MENECFQVNQFLAIIDNIFLHGIKRSNRQCWKVLTEFSKINVLLKESIENITNLPHIKTNLGRLRAWIRLTLMQKNFAEFFTQLIENQYLLNQYYENYGFILNEEAQIISGLLLSLNFTDFIFCLKEQNLDDIKISIDVGRYMKIASLDTFPNNFLNGLNSNLSANNSFDHDTISIDSSKESGRMTDILDQKNYLEEINRHNNCVINELKDKYHSFKNEVDVLKREISLISDRNIELETANSLLIANFEKPKYYHNKNNNKDDYKNNGANGGDDMVEPSGFLSSGDIGIALDGSIKSLTLSNEIAGLAYEDGVISQTGIFQQTHNRNNSTTSGSDNKSIIRTDANTLPNLNSEAEFLYKKTINELKQSLLEEKANKLKFEHQYQTVARRKEELEILVKHLEKSDKHKQELVVDLKRQLDDLKAINSEMYTKIENYEASLKHKNELVIRLEQKNRSVTSALKEIEEKYEKLQNYQSSTEDIFGKMERELSKKDQIKIQLENDLKLEREMKVSLQHQIQKDKLEFARRLKEISKAEDILKNNEYLHKRNEDLKKKCSEQEQTLSELGVKIKETTLQTDDLKDTMMPYIINSKWQKNDEVNECPTCHIAFSTLIRKHHCRNCGTIFCQECSKYKINMPFSSKPVRVCLQCYDLLNNKPNP
ncbi:protein RUFY3-like [Gordionus sp. m RMFG-2023]|uniref:protein RUFY3-like n=1 Tax=Gordionus sp. m RMFG-2023 TaxID=3053472 RepID=UPI0031FDA9C0